MRTSGGVAVLGLAAFLAGSAAGAQPVVVAPSATPWQDAAPPAAGPDDAAVDAAAARAVERLLATLQADDRDRRTLGLAVGVGGGAVVTGVGAWMLARGGSRSWELNAGSYVGAAGVGLMLGGVLNAVLPGYLHELSDSWRETAGQPVAVRRSHFGVVLDELADKARAGRRFAGFASLGLGAAFIVTGVLLDSAREHPSYEFFSPGLIAGVGGAFMIASSVPLLTMRTPIEHAAMFWHAGDARPSVRLAGASVLPTRGGALATVALVF
jgi:hypothetical protein